MYSCESERTKAHSNDLRWRMVYQRCMHGLTYEENGVSVMYAWSHIRGDCISVVRGSFDSMACRSALWRAWYG